MSPTSGSITIFAVLVIGSAGLVAALLLSLSGTDAAAQVHDQIRAIRTRHDVLGCLDEILLRLADDPNFSAAAVTTSTATCSVTWTTPPSGGRYADLQASDTNILRRLHVELTTDPVTVTRLVENVAAP